MGVANNKSIAWGCAKAMKDQGATLIYTYQNERMEKQLAKLAGPEDLLIECDVVSDESIRRAFSTIESRVGKIDGLVHAIAYSKKKNLMVMYRISHVTAMHLHKISQLTHCLL